MFLFQETMEQKTGKNKQTNKETNESSNNHLLDTILYSL